VAVDPDAAEAVSVDLEAAASAEVVPEEAGEIGEGRRAKDSRLKAQGLRLKTQDSRLIAHRSSLITHITNHTFLPETYSLHLSITCCISPGIPESKDNLTPETG